MTIILLLFSIYAGTVYGQIDTCRCPDENQSRQIFRFSTGEKIMLCGNKNSSKPLTYSDFTLTICGQDTAFDHWDDRQICSVAQKRDTLLVKKIVYVPTGRNFAVRKETWITEKIYFLGRHLERQFERNKSIRKYSKSEIQKILHKYETAVSDENDHAIDLAYELLMCA